MAAGCDGREVSHTASQVGSQAQHRRMSNTLAGLGLEWRDMVKTDARGMAYHELVMAGLRIRVNYRWNAKTASSPVVMYITASKAELEHLRTGLSSYNTRGVKRKGSAYELTQPLYSYADFHWAVIDHWFHWRYQQQRSAIRHRAR
jgi:hypothetical protein